jgi:hypothetical protein
MAVVVIRALCGRGAGLEELGAEDHTLAGAADVAGGEGDDAVVAVGAGGRDAGALGEAASAAGQAGSLASVAGQLMTMTSGSQATRRSMATGTCPERPDLSGRLMRPAAAATSAKVVPPAAA